MQSCWENHTLTFVKISQTCDNLFFMNFFLTGLLFSFKSLVTWIQLGAQTVKEFIWMKHLSVYCGEPLFQMWMNLLSVYSGTLV